MCNNNNKVVKKKILKQNNMLSILTFRDYKGVSGHTGLIIIIIMTIVMIIVITRHGNVCARL